MKALSAFVLCVCVLAAAAACPAAEPRVKLADNGAVLVDGKPFLPIFVWAQPSSAMEMHKELGVNVMHPGESEEKDPLEKYLEKAKQNNMLLLVGEGALSEKLLGNPNILAWTVEHEPDGAQPPAYEADLSADKAIIWIEGEAAAKSTLVSSAWLDKERLQLSGKHWITSEKKGEGEATWEFTASQEGEYNLWVREFTKSWANPTKWKIDDGQWQETPRSLKAEQIVNLGGGQGVAWTLYGPAKLSAGKHTITMQVVQGRTAGNADKEPAADAIWAVDAICFTTQPSFPPTKANEPLPTRLPEIEKAAYEKVKKADPNAITWNIMTAGFFGGYRKLDDKWYHEFLKYSDITSFDHYPITGWNQPGRLPEVGLATRRLVELARKGQPVWTIVEASDQDLSWTPKDTRGPSAAEMRAEIWSGIAGGAKGIGYFTIAFEPFRWNNLTDEIKAEMKRSNGELTELAAPIVMGDTEKKLEITGDETQDKSAEGHAIQAIRKDYEGKTYVIAVNVTREAAKPTFKVEGAKAAAAKVWKEDRTVELKDGSFTDAFEPLAVHVYVIE